jgi:hypothetical protein
MLADDVALLMRWTVVHYLSGMKRLNRFEMFPILRQTVLDSMFRLKTHKCPALINRTESQ